MASLAKLVRPTHRKCSMALYSDKLQKQATLLGRPCPDLQILGISPRRHEVLPAWQGRPAWQKLHSGASNGGLYASNVKSMLSPPNLAAHVCGNYISFAQPLCRPCSGCSICTTLWGCSELWISDTGPMFFHWFPTSCPHVPHGCPMCVPIDFY